MATYAKFNGAQVVYTLDIDDESDPRIDSRGLVLVNPSVKAGDLRTIDGIKRPDSIDPDKPVS